MESNSPQMKYSLSKFLWTLFCLDLFLVGLFYFGKNEASLQPMFRQINQFTGNRFFEIVAGIGLLLIIITFTRTIIIGRKRGSELEAKNDAQRWLLALSAIYVQLSSVLDSEVKAFERIDMTRPFYGPLLRGIIQSNFKKQWGIESKATALSTLEDLLEGAKKEKEKPVIAWDGVRYVHVARMSYITGYLTPRDVWQQLGKIAPVLQKKFSSWSDLGSNFLEGRKQWGGAGYDHDDLVKAYKELLSHPKSPWVTLPWGMKFDAYRETGSDL